MAKKPTPKSAPRRFPLPLLPVLGTVAVVVGGYFAVVWLGRVACEGLADRPRYRVKFDDIQCPSPPGLDRAAFLAEVRYLAHPPLEFSSVDPAVPSRLAAAFAKHPWVATAVPSDSQPAWPSPVHLVFRTPVLAVTLANGSIRVVDGTGVLLPASASSASLPRFVTPQLEPISGTGEAWLNLDVRRAVELAKDYDIATLEKTAAEWRISLKNGKVLTLTR